ARTRRVGDRLPARAPGPPVGDPHAPRRPWLRRLVEPRADRGGAGPPARDRSVARTPLRQPRRARGAGVAGAEDGPLSAPEPSRDVIPVYALRGKLPLPLWHLRRALRTALVASAFAGFW